MADLPSVSVAPTAGATVRMSGDDLSVEGTTETGCTPP